jgi:hypothetical protein
MSMQLVLEQTTYAAHLVGPRIWSLICMILLYGPVQFAVNFVAFYHYNMGLRNTASSRDYFGSCTVYHTQVLGYTNVLVAHQNRDHLRPLPHPHSIFAEVWHSLTIPSRTLPVSTEVAFWRAINSLASREISQRYENLKFVTVFLRGH